jgi:hypothetical protein
MAAVDTDMFSSDIDCQSFECLFTRIPSVQTWSFISHSRLFDPSTADLEIPLRIGRATPNLRRIECWNDPCFLDFNEKFLVTSMTYHDPSHHPGFIAFERNSHGVWIFMRSVPVIASAVVDATMTLCGGGCGR